MNAFFITVFAGLIAGILSTIYSININRSPKGEFFSAFIIVGSLFSFLIIVLFTIAIILLAVFDFEIFYFKWLFEEWPFFIN